jgi:hypothetical protein
MLLLLRHFTTKIEYNLMVAMLNISTRWWLLDEPQFYIWNLWGGIHVLKWLICVLRITTLKPKSNYSVVKKNHYTKDERSYTRICHTRQSTAVRKTSNQTIRNQKHGCGDTTDSKSNTVNCNLRGKKAGWRTGKANRGYESVSVLMYRATQKSIPSYPHSWNSFQVSSYHC